MREIKFRCYCEDANNMEYDVQKAYDSNVNCFNDYLICSGYEVMQYTGIKDKNGKEIYEGDIVKPIHADYHGEVEYMVEELKYVIRDIPSNFYYDFPFSDGAKCEKLEVIGNIYENPELLDT